MGRKKSGSSVIGLLLIGLLALLASLPKELWVAIGIFAAVIVIASTLRSAKKPKPPRTADKPIAETAPIQRVFPSARIPEATRQVESNASQPIGYAIPPPPKGFGAARWYGPGQTVEIAGRRISSGLVYVGTSLPCSAGGNDPCLIDPSKRVDPSGNFTLRQTNYWPSYSEISPSARAAYLDWLADGRHNADADVGYVFIFFYGLERRVILDTANDDRAKADWPAIQDELTQLLAVYGASASSFKGYASTLLTWMQLSERSGKTYDKRFDDIPKGYELPMPIRVALGQVALDGVPLPPHLALTWVKLAPEVFLRTPAIRCPEQFDNYFLVKYAEKFGAGMPLQCNRTKLRFAYQPASAGLRGYRDLRLDLGGLPDVTALTTPIKALQRIAEEVTDALSPYSRFLGRNPEARDSLEALLQLPARLWPDTAQKALLWLKSRVGDGMVGLSCGELFDLFKAKAALTKDRFIELARALESVQIGIEPDVLRGAKLPNPDDKVVLFYLPLVESISKPTLAYQTAVLTLQLAAAVASADGKFDPIELIYLSKQVKSWAHLGPNHQRRLMAHLRLLSVAPVPFATIKKQLEPLDRSARVAIASFMATVAQSDGAVTPSEIKILEKIYAALGVDHGKVFSDLHAAATNTMAPAKSNTERNPGFKLDAARIAVLQRDTELAAALLSNIFVEEPPQEAPNRHSDQETTAEPSGLLGLDESHSAFMRLLLSHREWSREELQDASADLELMLDGALEQINEACFDRFDSPLTEGDDPVKVNSEILEKVSA